MTPDMKALYRENDSAVLRQELAVMQANRSKTEQLRKRRAEFSEQQFIRQQSKEVWQ